MKIAVITETDSHETRVAASAETVKKLSALGASFTIESGAGQRSGITDADYETAGASIAKTAKAALKDALPQLATLLAQDGNASSTLDSGS